METGIGELNIPVRGVRADLHGMKWALRIEGNLQR
jgi:hypothetical protein